MQGELRHIQQATGTTFVYVTHDQEEALTMSDRIAVLNRGRVVQCDAPEPIFRRPRTRFVAEFFRGSNVLEAELRPAGGGVEVAVAGARVPLSEAVRPGRRFVAVRGERIRLGETDGMEAHLRLSAVLERITYRGLYSDYRLLLDDGQRLSAAGPHRHDLASGERLPIAIAAEDIVLLEDD